MFSRQSVRVCSVFFAERIDRCWIGTKHSPFNEKTTQYWTPDTLNRPTMSAFPYLVLLFCFIELGIHVSASTPSPIPNPECPGMHRIAKSLERGIKTYTREITICKVNNACTGLMCNGTHKGNDFYMKMELKHCKTPPSIYLVLKYQQIDFNNEIKGGKNIKISKKSPLELKLTLKKNRNKITTGLEIQICTVPVIGCQKVATLLPPTTFCLNMKTCPGYNSTGDIPCHVTPTTGNNPPTSRPTSPESHKIVSTNKVVPTALRFSTIEPSQHSESHKIVSTNKVVPTALRFSTTEPSQHSESHKIVSSNKVVPTALRFSTIEPSQHSGTTSLPGDTHAQKRGSGHHQISTGVAIGIAFACLLGVLIIVGAAFYWKKFYRRSRLRAAYYNDISMNDPLYEDFGPEVA